MVGGSNHQPVGGGLRGVLLRGYVLEKSWPRVSIRSPLPLYFLVRHLWVGARERAVNASGLARRRRNDKELSSSTFETVSKSGCRQTDSFRLGHEHTHTPTLFQAGWRLGGRCYACNINGSATYRVSGQTNRTSWLERRSVRLDVEGNIGIRCCGILGSLHPGGAEQ